MMRGGDRCEIGKGADATKDHLGVAGMGAHHRCFPLIELTGLFEDRARHAQLADIMQCRRVAQAAQPRRQHPEALPQPFGIIRHTAGVPGGVTALGIADLAEGANDRIEIIVVDLFRFLRRHSRHPDVDRGRFELGPEGRLIGQGDEDAHQLGIEPGPRAADDFLDRISADFFGTALPRRINEGDAAFRARILAELQRVRGTRPAIVQALVNLTGRTPAIFEPARPADTGAWNKGLGYGVAGGWGNLSLPAQFFVTAFRPSAAGIPAIAGWGAGGWNRGVSAYATLAMVQGAVTDPDIYGAVATTIPAGVVAWVHISN